MFTLRSIYPLAVAAMLPSCATLKDSVTLGISTGAVVGGAMGAAAGKADNNEARSAAIGAAAGAAIGGLAGYLGFKEQDQKSKLINMSSGKPSNDTPEVSKPQVRRVWIEPKVEADGTTYTSGHYIYVIDRQATFEQRN